MIDNPQAYPRIGTEDEPYPQPDPQNRGRAARERMTRAKAAFTDAVQRLHRREAGAVKACGLAIKEVNEVREELRRLTDDERSASSRARARAFCGG